MVLFQRILLWLSGQVIPYSVTYKIASAILPLLDFEHNSRHNRIGQWLLWYANAQGALVEARQSKQ